MKININRILALTLIGSFSLLLVGFIGFMLFLQLQKYRGRQLFEEVKNYRSGYIYDVVNNTIAPVCYISSLKDSTQLKNLYRDFEKYKYTPPSNDWIIRYNDSTYFNKISDNIYEFYLFDKECWGYLKGYIYKDLYQKVAPTDSLIKNFNIVPRLRQRKGISRMGIQCDVD